jgi:hypothetical protein
MPRLRQNEREQAVGMLLAGMAQDFINGIQLAKFVLLIGRTSSIYLGVRLKA